MDFKPFAEAVHQRLNELSKQELFVTVSGDELWDTYIKSFPPGTDPIFKVATKHTCTCCKQFIRGMGNVVAIVNGKLTSIWDVKGMQTPYKEVASAMHKLVTTSPITDLFRPTEPAYGAESTKKLMENGDVHRFNHFWGKVAKKHVSPTPDKTKGDYKTTVQVFQRGLDELKIPALTQVLELIEGNALYRGAEHRQAVHVFKTMKEAYLAMPQEDRNAFLWQTATQPVARFRNTVIGTLVQDLSEGVEVDRAVASFEQKVAPTNYKRTTALITPSMVQAAMKTLKDLDLEAAVERRFATIKDVNVNNVLWVDSKDQSKMIGGLESLLMAATVQDVDAKAQDVFIEDFMKTVLPKATGLEVYLKGNHMPHLMSVTAPQHKDAGNLFKWDNNFAWSYNGNITDSITEKVKNAGGNVNAKVRVSLAWHNYSDLDLECVEPSGNRVYFGNKSGVLDVDMNAGGGHSREPVENLSWSNPQDGVYKVAVNQYQCREKTDVGFTLAAYFEGSMVTYKYTPDVVGRIQAMEFTVKNGSVVAHKVHKDLDSGGLSVDAWGLQTEKFARVQTVMNSPNYWDGNEVGNKHWFFILEGCTNPEGARGFYNEFLSSKLEAHRKVFEVLSGKMMCQPTSDQLSGLGFSSTKKDSLTVAVTYKGKRRQYKVQF